MIKALMFDIGGVVVIEPHDSWKNIFSELGPPAGINPRVLVSEFLSSMKSVQTGNMTLLEFYRKFTGSPESLVKKHLEIYMKLSGRYDPEMLGLIKKLKRKFVVACFTNTEPELTGLHRKRGLFARFDRAFISTEMGLRKPDAAAYRHVIKELGISPEEGVFIDNSGENVNAAEKAGLHGIIYTDMSKLKKDLLRCGVNI